jgi:glycosyltransferase involved in cell wall biosynthesis
VGFLKVLQVSYALAAVGEDTAGGAEQVLASLDRALVEAGHLSAVVAPEGSRATARLYASHRVEPPFDDAHRRALTRSHARAVRHAVERERFDVVHLHGVEFDEVVPRDGPPAVVTLHLPPTWYIARPLERWPGLRFVCVSDAQARTLPPGVPLAGVVPNGVQLDAFRPAADREPYVLLLARVCPEKGIHLALDAARRARVPLVVAGEVFDFPEHVRYFEQEIRPRLDAERRFVGRVGLRDKARLLSRARCLVVPSLAPETSSLVAMEALASGTPVVARATGALPEIVDEGRTGFLVHGVGEMADAMREAARLSREECRRVAEARFSAAEMARRYVDVYRRIRSRGPARPYVPPRADAARPPA